MNERGQADWPPQWELSAPESHVIELRGGANGDVPLVLAVKELVVHGVLSAQEVKRSWLFDATPRVYAITDGPRLDVEMGHLLDPALTAYRAAPRREAESIRDESTVTGVRIGDLIETAHEQLGGASRYFDDYLAPTLVEQGLLEPAGRRGMRSRPDFDWTDEGRQADRVLYEWLELGRANLTRWASIDPVSGARFLSGAGAALLLLDGHAPELTRLGQRLAMSAGRLDGPPGNEVDMQEIAAVALTVADIGGLSNCKLSFGAGDGD